MAPTARWAVRVIGVLTQWCAALADPTGIAAAAASEGRAGSTSRASAGNPSVQVSGGGPRISVTLEACGRMRVDGRSITLAQLCDVVRDRIAQGRAAGLELIAEPDLSRDDLDALLRRIVETGVERDRIRVRRGVAPPAPPHESRAVGAWLKRLWPGARRAVGAAASDESRIAREVEWRGESLQSRIEAVERIVEPWLETPRAVSRPAPP